MRRLILEEPTSAAAVWSFRLAAFAIAVALIAVGLARGQIVDIVPSLAVFGASMVIGCLAVLFALAGVVVIWRTGRRGVGTVAAAFLLATLLLAFPTYLTYVAVRLPLINDVSTDLIDPPDFLRSGRALAARGGLEHPETAEATRETQRRAYPDIQPIVLDLDVDEAWQLVLKALAARGWRVVDQVKPGGRSGLGHIDAIDRTAIMGFPEDITIRLRPLAGQTRIDIRSASRFGRHDFGSNARRIEAFATELQTQLDAK
jgi:uncharacterized protein (DUF1499 family)